MAIASTLSETIGNTPLLRLTRVTQGIVDQRDHPLDDYTRVSWLLLGVFL